MRLLFAPDTAPLPSFVDREIEVVYLNTHLVYPIATRYPSTLITEIATDFKALIPILDWHVSCIIQGMMFRPKFAIEIWTKAPLAPKGDFQMFTVGQQNGSARAPMDKRLFGAIVIVAIFAMLVTTGCGGGSNIQVTTAGPNSTTISFGDAADSAGHRL